MVVGLTNTAIDSLRKKSIHLIMGGWVDGPQGQSEGGTVICPTVDNGVCMHTGSTVSLFMYLARLSRLSFEDGGFNHASQEPFLSTILICMLTFFKVLEMLRRKCHMALSISAIWHSLVNSLFFQSKCPFSRSLTLRFPSPPFPPTILYQWCE